MEKTTLAIIDENEEPEIDVIKKPYSFRFSDDQMKMIDAAVQSMDLKSRTKLLEYALYYYLIAYEKACGRKIVDPDIW